MFVLSILFIQIAVILAAARGLGFVFGRFHQPQVIGEMLAGIMLGPSLLGWLTPGTFAVLFPSSSLDFINAMSQIGLVVFMFLVGLELDLEVIRKRGHSAVVISHTSIIVPFVLGALLAVFLYSKLSIAGVPFTSFALFLGVSMSITAFPVLARILSEGKMIRTSVGSVAMAAAAVDDATAWTILAGVVLLVGASATSLPLWAIILGAIAYALFMVFVGSRWLKRIGVNNNSEGTISQNQLGLILLLVLCSALVTEGLGIHPLFGAFLLGVVMPKGASFVQALKGRLEDLVVVLLLPLYFAYTGLRTSVGLISGPALFYFGLILLVAVVGKFCGAFFASRLTGMSWRESGSIGVLMNTRGMVELVALNIGLDIGVISRLVFTLLVLMAIITTLMTTPILDWIYPHKLRVIQSIVEEKKQSFRQPQPD